MRVCVCMCVLFLVSVSLVAAPMASCLDATKLLTDADEKRISEFLELLHRDKWTESSHTEDGIVISWMKDPDNPAIIVKGSTPIKAPLRTTFEWMTDDATFQQCMQVVDPMCSSAKVIQRVDAKHTVQWAQFKLPPPLWDREFLWSGLATMLPSGAAAVLGSSTEHPDCPEPSGWFAAAVRGLMMVSGYLIEPGEGDACTVSYVIQADLKGMIPQAVVNLLATEQGKNVGRMKEYLENLHAQGR